MGGNGGLAVVRISPDIGTYTKKLITLKYSNNAIILSKYEYIKKSGYYFEQRFSYTNGKISTEEVKDDLNGLWNRITYTYDISGSIAVPTYETITTWSLPSLPE